MGWVDDTFVTMWWKAVLQWDGCGAQCTPVTTEQSAPLHIILPTLPTLPAFVSSQPVGDLPQCRVPLLLLLLM